MRKYKYAAAGVDAMRQTRAPAWVAALILVIGACGLFLPLAYKIGIPLLAILAALRVAGVISHKPLAQWLLILAFAAGIVVLLPAYYSVSFVNTKGVPINGTVLVDGDILREISGENVWFFLPRGKFTLTYTGAFRAPQQEERRFWSGLYQRRAITLAPGTFDHGKTIFTEPYKLVFFSPEIRLKGKTIDGNAIDAVGGPHTRFPYGEYEVEYVTRFLSNDARITPGSIPDNVTLLPNKNTVILTEQEAGWIERYLRDYLELSAQGIIPDAGFPKQYHLFTKNATLSLGDMLFVLCQLDKREQPVIYAPRDWQYGGGGGTDCYASLLEGRVPDVIEGKRAEQAIYEQVSDVTRTIPFAFGDLNQKRRALDWALSFDIEYGRYVPAEGVSPASASTCAVSSKYLSAEQCADPDFAGWTTPAKSVWWFGEYGYPVSSGLVGWRYILELGSQYGIPSTHYVVVRDARLFGEKDNAVLKLSQQLARQGLIEVASHTRYHTRLDMVPESTVREELLQSRLELERLYDVPVTGFRPPYLSMVNGSIEATESALKEAGYSYYSVYGDHRGSAVEHKPINFFGYLGYATPELLDAAFSQRRQVISLDHPWNILFREQGEPVVLEEAPAQPVQTKALILTALSRGAHFTTVRDLEIK